MFKSLAEENAHLVRWESQVADHRIHGTTRKQVALVFERERPALLPLPSGYFPCFQEGQRWVHRDAHVEVAKAYYSVPPEYVGRQVWVRWEARTVRIYNHRFERIALHARHEPGRFSTQPAHLDHRKISGVEQGAEALTSNRPIEEWGKLIGDVPAATAILDRFLHHAQVIPITGRQIKKILAERTRDRVYRSQLEWPVLNRPPVDGFEVTRDNSRRPGRR